MEYVIKLKSKNNIYFVFIIILTTNVLFASSDSEQVNLPPYCDVYKRIAQKKATSENCNKDGIIFSTCRKGEMFSLSVDDLDKNLNSIKYKSVKTNAKQFSRDLADKTFVKLYNAKLELAQIFPSVTNSIRSDAKECAKKNNDELIKNISKIEKKFPRLNTPNREKKKKNFIESNVVNAFMAKAYLNLKNKYNRKSKQLSKDVYNECMKSATAITYSFDVVKCGKKGDNAKIKLEKKGNKLISPMYNIVQNSPILFKEKIKKFGFAIDLDSSNFTNYIEENTKNGNTIIKEIEKKLEKGEDPLSIFKENGKSILNGLIGDPSHYHRLLRLAKDGADKHLGTLDDSASTICDKRDEVEGSYLHLNPSAVESQFSLMKNSNQSTKEYKAKLIENQAAYCYLLDEHPTSSKVSPALIGGFSLLAVGASAQFIPFVGNLLGGYSAYAGATMIAGGTVLAGVGAKDLADSHYDYIKEKGLFFSNWSDWDKVNDKFSTRSTNIAFAVLDVVIFPFDIKALKAMHQAAKTKKVEKAVATVVDTIDENKKLIRFGDEALDAKHTKSKELPDNIKKMLPSKLELDKFKSGHKIVTKEINNIKLRNNLGPQDEEMLFQLAYLMRNETKDQAQLVTRLQKSVEKCSIK